MQHVCSGGYGRHQHRVDGLPGRKRKRVSQMAIVQLKNVKVYATFSKGFRVIEESKGRDGKDYSTRWTVWSDTLGVAEGDVVSLSGFLSAKVNEWSKDGETRHSVELSLNSPRLAGNTPETASQGEQWATTPPTDASPSQGDWGTDAESPF